MARKRKKTIKVEIPVPGMPSASNIKKNVPTRQLEIFVKKNRQMLLGVLVVVVAVALIYGLSTPAETHDIQNQPLTKTVNVQVPENISFDRYMTGYQQYADKQITIKGMLLHRLVEGLGRGSLAVHEYYLVDDFGAEIHLTGLTEAEKMMFPETGKSDTVYDVRGIVKTKYKTFDFDVTDISPGARGMTIVTKEVPA
ncbi:MAG: hypothetical protein J7K54_03535 [Candidatus Aenigmarchaeota archaeon]|nr:hypothetical protein [Candidatus Aenigmarchaeota archaeon]